MRRILLLAAGLVLFPIQDAVAQQGSATLVLTVFGHETGQPLEGVQVSIADGAIGGVTDEDGMVRVSGISAGSHLVVIRRIGYGTERIRIDFSPGEVVEGEVELAIQPVPLEDLEVDVERRSPRLRTSGFYGRRQSHPGGTFLTRDDIESRPRSSVASELLRRIPSIRMVPVPRGFGYAVTSTRGRCYAQVYLDGIPMSGDLDSTGRMVSGPDIDQIISVHAIEAIEWYPGAADLPVEFNRMSRAGSGGAGCGALVIWTRAGR